eukprot:2122174-Prorocentrum_lima.AAC.1
MTRRTFELWLAEITVKIGTWGATAQDQWVNMVKQARRTHEDGLELSQDEQAVIEGSFLYGDELP